MNPEESQNGTSSTIFSNPTKVLTFRCLFLAGEGHVSSKVIDRSTLAECQLLKNVEEKDLEPILRFYASINKDMYQDCLKMLVPTVLLRDSSGDLFLVQKQDYWW